MLSFRLLVTCEATKLSSQLHNLTPITGVWGEPLFKFIPRPGAQPCPQITWDQITATDQRPTISSLSHKENFENSWFTCFMIKGIEFRIISYVCPSPVPIKPGRLLLEPISVNFRVRGKVLEWLVAVQNLKWRRNVCRVHNISCFSVLHSALHWYFILSSE